MSKPIIISVVNQKGGIGKTTTAMNVGCGLQSVGKKVLLIDLDYQCNLSKYLGFDFSKHPTISELIYGEVAGQSFFGYEDCIIKNEEGVDYIPASQMLAGLINTLGEDRNRQSVLRRIFQNEFFNKYDYILFDCRPDLELLVINAMVASTHLLIPLQAEPFSVDGLNKLLDTYKAVVATQNPNLRIMGMLITMVDKRMAMPKVVEETLRDAFGSMVFHTVIPRISEAVYSVNNQRSLISDKNSQLGKCYMNVVEEILNV